MSSSVINKVLPLFFYKVKCKVERLQFWISECQCFQFEERLHLTTTERIKELVRDPVVGRLMAGSIQQYSSNWEDHQIHL